MKVTRYGIVGLALVWTATGCSPAGPNQVQGAGTGVIGATPGTSATTLAPPAVGQPGATGTAGTATTPAPTAAPGTPTPAGGSPAPTATPTSTTPAPAATPSGGGSCASADPLIVGMDETGWVTKNCTASGMQGAWYCYTDGVNATSCVQDTAPYRAGAMCLSGSTTVDDTYAAWGAGIGFTLNDPGVSGQAKQPFNADAAQIIGFAVTITGETNGLDLRIGFTGSTSEDDIAPFVQVPGPGSYEVTFAQADISWEDAAPPVDPTTVYDVQIQVVGAEAAADYDFCISELRPIYAEGAQPTPPAGGVTPTPGNTGAAALPTFGNARCARYDEIDLGGMLMLQNNIWNDEAANQQQCVTALYSGSGGSAGFRVDPISIAVSSFAPASYPALVLGWHYGTFHGAYKTAKTVSSIASVPTTWDFTVSGGGKYDASYDLWVHPQGAPTGPEGGLEMMIWLSHRGAQPIGANTGSTVTIAGDTYEVWYGANDGGWNTVSYRRPTNTSSANFDLKGFIDDSVQRGYAQASWYLLSVQAGFEPWEMTDPMVTNSFSASVN